MNFLAYVNPIIIPIILGGLEYLHQKHRRNHRINDCVAITHRQAERLRESGKRIVYASLTDEQKRSTTRNYPQVCYEFKDVIVIAANMVNLYDYVRR